MQTMRSAMWAGLIVSGLSANVLAWDQVRHWQGAGNSGVGDYHVSTNWVQGSVPGTGDLAGFNNTGAKNWLVTLTGDATNDTFSVMVPPAGYETAFNLNQRTYWVTNALNVWTGACGRVTISNGLLRVKAANFSPSPDGLTTNLFLTARSATLEFDNAVFSATYATFDSGSLGVSNRLTVGGFNRGRTTLLLTNGVRCNVANELYAGFESGATGELVNVDGVLRHSGFNNCVIGGGGNGTLTLVGGATRTDRTATLGSGASGTGTLNVLGGSNTFATVTNDRLNVGDVGKGYLLGCGGTNSVMGLVFANSAGGYGEGSITGGLWRIADHMWVGMSGKGLLTLSGGQMIFTGGGPVLAIGRYAGATGEVTVAGGVMDMGSNGSVWLGRLDSGTVAPSGRLVLTGTGVLRTKTIFEYTAAAASQLVFDGGTLQAAASGALVYSVDDVRLTAKGMVVDSATYSVSVATLLQDAAGEAGGITKKGAGTLTLAGVRSATGPVSVLGGTLVASNHVAVAAGTSRIDGTLTLTGTSRLTVGAGAALAGTGSVARVTLQDHAVIARAKADNASAPLTVSDCVAENRLSIALTGYSISELKTAVPLIRAPTAFIDKAKVTVTLNGQASSLLTAKFVEVGGQQVLYAAYSAGTLITVW